MAVVGMHQRQEFFKRWSDLALVETKDAPLFARPLDLSQSGIMFPTSKMLKEGSLFQPFNQDRVEGPLAADKRQEVPIRRHGDVLYFIVTQLLD